MRISLLLFGILFLFQEPVPKPDAAAMETQYRTCAKHYIPAEKCTAEVYQQLKDKDSALPDEDTKFVLSAIREYRSRLKNPESMQIRAAFVLSIRCKKCGPDDRTVCLDVGALNGLGGMTREHAARVTRVGKTRWEYEGDLPGPFGGHVDPWDVACKNVNAGLDLTDKVNEAIKRAS